MTTRISIENRLLNRTCGTGATTVTSQLSYHAGTELLEQTGSGAERTRGQHGRGSAASDRLHAGREQERHATRRIWHRAALWRRRTRRTKKKTPQIQRWTRTDTHTQTNTDERKGREKKISLVQLQGIVCWNGARSRHRGR